MAFRFEDVGYAIELLKHMDAREPLELSQELCIYSINVLNRDSAGILGFDGQPDMTDGHPTQLSPRSKRQALRT